MRVLVAGATGAIGRPLLPRLLAAGHEVTALTRSEARAAPLRETGAAPVIGDALDVESVGRAVREAATEVIVHQLTALPERFDFKNPDLYTATNRLRTEGTRNLLSAAREAGTKRFVCQSIAFAYEPSGGMIKSESDPLMRDAPGLFGSAVRALSEMESMVAGAEGIDGIVLRYGFFYGPGTYYDHGGSVASDTLKRRMPVVGKGGGLSSFVHVEDAADATVVAVEHGAAGTFNIVDDEPAAMKDWLPVYARALGAKKPLRVPVLVARLVAGKEVAALATQTRGASNEKAKRELGWRPAHPSWRQGVAEALSRPR
ncbi:MAG TPA: NAD(P)-dependent oxidoreductase [Thermoleophilaceae bacterium]|nr:NAD(P)-dependent oxidoreductase [Thermoleophilaceae bacterium]